ncbi:MAG TPA: hypothetical protein VKY89_23380 [Thermoanaerobaculia bacterium]|jgi:hypothetical protein|nr:hypothetical protein [Thermoanaerobaculia bacterium]
MKLDPNDASILALLEREPATLPDEGRDLFFEARKELLGQLTGQARKVGVRLVTQSPHQPHAGDEAARAAHGHVRERSSAAQRAQRTTRAAK